MFRKIIEINMAIALIISVVRCSVDKVLMLKSKTLLDFLSLKKS